MVYICTKYKKQEGIKKRKKPQVKERKDIRKRGGDKERKK